MGIDVNLFLSAFDKRNKNTDLFDIVKYEKYNDRRKKKSDRLIIFFLCLVKLLLVMLGLYTGMWFSIQLTICLLIMTIVDFNLFY